MIKVKSAHATVTPDDGKRILIDLFWPEGLKTREAAVDSWFPKLGPSYDLQRFDFNVSAWGTYREKYEKEVLENSEKKRFLDEIKEMAKESTVTLLYGNKDSVHNHAVILKELVENNK